VPPVLLVSGVLILGFGALTIGLRDDTFIKLKPTIVNLFYAVAVLGALALGHNVWRLLFQHAFAMPRRIWDVLALRWGLFFLAMAGLNEVLRQIMTQAEWVNARLWLVYPLIGLFMLANLPITLKWIGKSDEEYEAAKRGGARPADASPPAA
jgi:intracellular septation protein